MCRVRWCSTSARFQRPRKPVSGRGIVESINHREIRNVEEASRLGQKAKDKRTLLRVWSHSGSHFMLVDESQSGQPADFIVR